MANLTDYGFEFSELSEGTAFIPARVTAVYRERYELICEHGRTFGRLKTTEYYGGSEAFPTTGDFVLIDYVPGGDVWVVQTLPRKSYFSRRDPSPGKPGEQAVAANFDYVFIMQSLNNDLNVRRLERYLTLAWQSGALPVVLLTKADLTEDYGGQVRDIERAAAGVPIYAVSAKTGSGLDALDRYLQPGKTIVFLGSSGVGKSSLVNALAGEEIMAVNDIREDDDKGRHTTTHRQLIMLKSGVMIIDTPGMRELGMWDVTEGLGQSFADVEQYTGGCKFRDCKHRNEPGCAVKAAVERGELSMERLNSYLGLKNEARYSDDKGAYMRQKQQFFKTLAKNSRNKKKNGKF